MIKYHDIIHIIYNCSFQGAIIMKNKFNKLLMVISILLSIIYVISINITKVSAALTSSTDLAVLKQAPDGIGLGSYMSNSAPTAYDSKDIYTTNSAQIVDHSGANSFSGNIISLASGKNTYGSMWSTDKTFDINKKQTISAWLYFGDGTENSDAINSEGIAFVLQNDSHNTGALGAGLEGMGVYGYDASQYTLISGSPATQSYIKNTAIQNSVALEFDSAKNNFYTPGKPLNNNGTAFNPPFGGLGTYFSLDGYDTQLGKSVPSTLGFGDDATYGAGGSLGHIALTYPGYANTYQSTDLSNAATNVQNAYSPFTTGFVMVHNGSTSATLIDDFDTNKTTIYWHHVTISWTPAASGSTNATLTYTFNDRYVDGRENPNTTNNNFKKFSKSISVDTSKLNTTDGKVRWGFTAANGPDTNVSTKLVALDSIPDTLYSDADASITDTTLGDKKITDDSTDNTVSNGDSLKLNYNLTYVEGNQDWKDIATNIKIPDNVTLVPDSSGNVATITYADGSTENISQSELTSGYLKHTLAKSLSSSNASAKITVNAKVNSSSTTANTTVKAAAATFTGSNSIATTSSPKFVILAEPTYTLKLSNTAATDDLELLYKQDNATLNLPTALSYSDNHSFGDSSSNTNVIYEITAGDKTYTVGASATGTSFDQTIDLKSLMDDTTFWNLFTVGSTNKVTIKAIDQANGLVSNTVTYNVSTKQNKSLSMTVSNNLAFKDVNYGDTTEYLQRKNDFDLSVTSLRSPWQLNVTTNGLYLNGKNLNNDMALVFKKNTDSNYETLGASPTVIDQNNTSYDTSNTDNVSDDWTSNTGILLKQLGISPAGSYTGTLTWTVSDSIVNETT